MSLTGSRAAIAAALSTVDDVHGFEFPPTAPTTGDGWPRLGALDRDAGLSFICTWSVFLFLPQDERAADAWIDAHHEDLVDALAAVGFVDRVAPVKLAAAGSVGESLALMITLRS